jgi:hypothetical protein
MTNQTVVIDDIELAGIAVMADGTYMDIRDGDFDALVREALTQQVDTASIHDILAGYGV